ncbi:hypothetical protein PVA45_08320 (plasmid) [Entomospira entomophila]|uniref:Uncharacterized protein n=1 Tax=Entomospira entomophila TaxID=2719988 RepID=A0A968KTK2_9SPIO|nr:hypothetical protein [Entomospira entomophilus]NIZ41537.1 hypothetical protein [Entomospira entomophilus]WDI36435.1 hypothetical protein PVA45_08320 [Entomospira entomophilus]
MARKEEYYLYPLKRYNRLFGTNHKVNRDGLALNCIDHYNVYFIPLHNANGEPDLSVTITKIEQDFPAIIDRKDLQLIFGLEMRILYSKLPSFQIEQEINYLRQDLINYLEQHYYCHKP